MFPRAKVGAEWTTGKASVSKELLEACQSWRDVSREKAPWQAEENSDFSDVFCTGYKSDINTAHACLACFYELYKHMLLKN